MAQVDHLSQHDDLDRPSDRLREPPTLRTPVAQPAPAARDHAPTAARRLEQAIIRIDPRSVLNLSLGFFARMLLVGVGLGVLLWLGALVTGTASSIDTFIQELSGYPSLTVLGFQGLLVAIVLGLVFVFGGAFVAVLAVVVFNMASDLGGGIKMTVMETELDEGLVGGSSKVTGSESSGPQPLASSGRARRSGSRRPVLGANVSSLTASTDAADARAADGDGHREPHQPDQRPSVLRGALVVGVEHDSPAHSAGLQAGDVIVSVHGTTVDSPASLSDTLNDHDSDGPTDMSWVDQHGRYRTAMVQLGDRSA
ncbi:MAG TPA: PDZ domain-containing protein [Acidimicrobiales bacterium]|nr:PDZ domain-containing protein [Acidimicrobiales bacterium]